MGFDSWDMYNVGERSLYPGPIDNSGLFSGKTLIYSAAQLISCSSTFFLVFYLFPLFRPGDSGPEGAPYR